MTDCWGLARLGRDSFFYSAFSNIYNILKYNIMAITYMTKEGYKKKMEEIAYLESVERPKISHAIGEARDRACWK